MAALTSPGISITITDESQYLPTAVGTIPFVLFASAQDKTINGSIAPGTKKTNAGKVYGISSQRELVATFGAPNFRTNSAGSAIHADELNEYGLMAAYSALSLGNRVWAMRADVNLSDLVGTPNRPIGSVSDGTNWLDTKATAWGIYEYDQLNNEFTNKVPLVISSWDDIDVVGGIPFPLDSIGNIGSYAVVTRVVNNYVFYKNTDNVWVQVGSTDWQDSFPAAIGDDTSPNLSAGGTFSINGTNVVISASGSNTVTTIKNAINSAAISGVSAEVVSGFLAIYINDSSSSTGSTPDGAALIVDTPGLLNACGISAGTYYAPDLYFGGYNQIPSWSSADAIPRPTGSVWVKTTIAGNGTNIVIKQYDANQSKWNRVSAPLYEDGYAALADLDPLDGGASLPVGTFFVKYDADSDGTLSYKVYTLKTAGETAVSGSVAAGTFTSGDTFNLIVSEVGTTNSTTYPITLGGTNGSAFVTAILAANIPEVTCSVNTSGIIKLTHKYGGFITLINTTVGRNPVTTAGFTSNTSGVQTGILDVDGLITLTNWEIATYTFSDTEPYTAPDDGTLWYYSDATAIDIMVCDTDGWKGYKRITRDIRGYDLSATDPNGVIVSATKPETNSQNDALVAGDLWLDSSDLENYPRLYRYTSTNKWQLIDNTDRITQNGIVFADARWDGDSNDDGGNVDPITGTPPDVAAMQNSNYIDLDAPDYRLFPRGTLLFNTRRSGYNVKKYIGNYFNEESFPNDPLPTIKATWITESGNKQDGTPYAGHHAQRAIIVKALKAALDSSLDIRDEGYNFNLLVCPGYPELVVNLIALNNDRSNTGFVIGDMPMTLPATVTAITQYNTTEATKADPYVALYYPSALTNDLSGNEIAVPASHVALRTYIRNDNLAYPWFAPAGTRRGLVDNANAIGYVDANSGLFISTGINRQLRDAMYEININPITLLQGTGLVVYGQKTRNAQTSALDRVNVARLVNYLRTVLQPLANQFLFEPNDKITRDQVKQVIESVMNDLVAKRGLYDYLVVCDTSNNTPDRIARNELYVDIAVEPMKSVEFIYIPIRLKNPGTISGA